MEWNAISNLVPEAFSRIDEDEDCFERIKGVASDLLYGDASGKDRPWFSVVIPTYRRKELLREAVESVLAQNPVDFPWELIVVDNTPLDGQGWTPAQEAIRELGSPPVLYYHNRENIGSGYNWNRGAELARGEWIVFLHDDDLLLPDALGNLGRQIRAYRGKKPLGYVYARRAEFTGKDRPETALGTRRYPRERLTRFGVLISGCTGAGAPTCGTAILKEAYLKTGGVNYAFGPSADEVICYQIMRQYAVVLSRQVLGGYRWGENESLRKDTLLLMIRADELLSEYTYARSSFARRWGRVFGGASTWRNIHRKTDIARRYEIPITKEEFAAATGYPEPGTLKKTVFLGIYAFYRFCRLLSGVF
ncbi:MAG: glycosyltransferase family 2 protein [Oscillospiraceae bacterium]|nr:glycosyltransferase family 2 protein [Oscillospiraceae bacterium]